MTGRFRPVVDVQLSSSSRVQNHAVELASMIELRGKQVSGQGREDLCLEPLWLEEVASTSTPLQQSRYLSYSSRLPFNSIASTYLVVDYYPTLIRCSCVPLRFCAAWGFSRFVSD